MIDIISNLYKSKQRPRGFNDVLRLPGVRAGIHFSLFLTHALSTSPGYFN